MLPVVQLDGLADLLVALVFSLPGLVISGRVVSTLSRIAEYDRQTVQALGRTDVRLEDIQNPRPSRAAETARDGSQTGYSAASRVA